MPGSDSTEQDALAVGQSPSPQVCGLTCCNTVANKSSSSVYHSKL